MLPRSYQREAPSRTLQSQPPSSSAAHHKIAVSFLRGTLCQQQNDACAWRRAGGLVATRQEIKQYPTRTNQIPRHIPPPHWASHPFVLFLAAGLLPFGTIFVELYFAMTSIWQASPGRRRDLAKGASTDGLPGQLDTALSAEAQSRHVTLHTTTVRPHSRVGHPRMIGAAGKLPLS